MLKFDSNHSKVEGNVKEKKGMSKMKKAIIAGLIITNIVSFSGCAKIHDCDVLAPNHSHYYVSQEEDLGRYIYSEKETVSGLTRTDEYKVFGIDELELQEFMNKNGLYKISENKEAIQKIIDFNKEYAECPIEYTEAVTTLEYDFSTEQYVPVIRTETTTEWEYVARNTLNGADEQADLVFYAYKVTKNEQGEYIIIKSEAEKDIWKLYGQGYTYIKSDFVKDLNQRTEKDALTSVKEESKMTLQNYEKTYDNVPIIQNNG